MKLVKILSSVIEENVEPKHRIMEISNRLMNQLVLKFKDETQDDEDTIKSYIDDFEKYKNGLAADKRDITKYAYNQLKSVISTKRLKKEENDIFKKYIKGPGKGSDQRQVKSAIKKFLEIREFLPEQYRNIMDYSYLKLVELIQRAFGTTITKKAFEKYMEWTEPMIDDIKNSPVAGHQIERSIPLFYLLNDIKSMLIPEVLSHYQLNSHNT